MTTKTTLQTPLELGSLSFKTVSNADRVDQIVRFALMDWSTNNPFVIDIGLSLSNIFSNMSAVDVKKSIENIFKDLNSARIARLDSVIVKPSLNSMDVEIKYRNYESDEEVYYTFSAGK